MGQRAQRWTADAHAGSFGHFDPKIDAKLRNRASRVSLRRLIEVMAILGTAVEYTLLSVAAEQDVPPDQFDPLLMELVRLGIVVCEGSVVRSVFDSIPSPSRLLFGKSRCRTKREPTSVCHRCVFEIVVR